MSSWEYLLPNGDTLFVSGQVLQSLPEQFQVTLVSKKGFCKEFRMIRETLDTLLEGAILLSSPED